MHATLDCLDLRIRDDLTRICSDADVQHREHNLRHKSDMDDSEARLREEIVMAIREVQVEHKRNHKGMLETLEAKAQENLSLVATDAEAKHRLTQQSLKATFESLEVSSGVSQVHRVSMVCVSQLHRLILCSVMSSCVVSCVRGFPWCGFHAVDSKL